MTQDEFLTGWYLLVIQPWGQKYNRTTSEGQPEAASKLQLEFYFDKLKHGTAGAWMRTAQQYAMGRAWPTVVDLRTTMRHHEVPGRQLTHREDRQTVPMPDDVKAMVLRIFGAPQRQFGPYVDDSVPEKQPFSKPPQGSNHQV
jgi:hypothetical protein